MIIYISDARADLLDAVCDKLYLIVSKVRHTNLKKLLTGGGADFSHASRLVIDLAAVRESGAELADTIAAFRKMYKSVRIIVLADKEHNDAQLFSRLFDLGVYDIVTELSDEALQKSLTTGMTKEDAERFKLEKPVLTANITATERAPPVAGNAPAERITANRDWKSHRPFITVAVCGTEPKSGATHHALLLAGFLSGAGFKTCYLEANPRRSVRWIARLYPVNSNDSKGLLQFAGVDMYSEFKLPEVIATGYEFLVFDLGRFGECDVSAFLTKDVKVIVGGSKPWELPAYSEALDALGGYRDVHCIANFAAQTDADALRSLLEERELHLSEYVPYPFVRNVNLEIYKRIFRDYITVEHSGITKPERKKFNLWKR